MSWHYKLLQDIYIDDAIANLKHQKGEIKEEMSLPFINLKKNIVSLQQ
jgi:hypothetical protein